MKFAVYPKYTTAPNLKASSEDAQAHFLDVKKFLPRSSAQLPPGYLSLVYEIVFSSDSDSIKSTIRRRVKYRFPKYRRVLYAIDSISSSRNTDGNGAKKARK